MKNSKSIFLKNNIEELELFSNELDEFCKINLVNSKIFATINLIADELISNIIFYSFEDKKEHIISVSIHADSLFFTMKIISDGKDFDPRNAKPADIESGLDKREIGGLGIHLVLKMVDFFDYERKNGKSTITIKKKLK